MLGGIHWPDAETAVWMLVWGGLAALAHFLYFSVYRGLPEWRIRLARWRGEEPSPADIADTRGYRPHPPDPPLDSVAQAVALGLTAATWVWAGDYSGRQAEAIQKTAEALFVAVLLLWSLRAPRGEVGAPPADEDEKRQKPSWWNVLFLFGFAAFIWFEPFQSSLLPYFIGAAVIAGAFWFWHWWNTPEELRQPLLPHAEVPQEAVLGFLAALAIVTFMLGIIITLAV